MDALTDKNFIPIVLPIEPWGLCCSIDLYGCNPNFIRDEKHVHAFSSLICDLIEMKKFGEPLIKDFGREEKVAGLTMVQLIETSSITAHFANATQNAYIDIFSCKKFDMDKAANFCREYFEAKAMLVGRNKRF